jgi:hypothetical protein
MDETAYNLHFPRRGSDLAEERHARDSLIEVEIK